MQAVYLWQVATDRALGKELGIRNRPMAGRFLECVLRTTRDASAIHLLQAAVDNQRHPQKTNINNNSEELTHSRMFHSISWHTQPPVSKQTATGGNEKLVNSQRERMAPSSLNPWSEVQ